MRTACAALLLLLIAESAAARRFESKSPSTTNNDDSCDIALMPAATLLLPYFEVDVASPRATARTTLFSLTNVSPTPQIAQVTLWTDLGRAVLTFPVSLTGYDVQSIDLYDVLVRGAIESGGATGTCALVPNTIPPPMLEEVRFALTTGRSPRTCGVSMRVGLVHIAAIGYATIDVVATCGLLTPADGAAYFRQLLFDNVLTGDYHQLDPDPARPNAAAGSPMVHIRAVPEGGPAGVVAGTNLPYTFYDRFTAGAPSRQIDRRQPLPSRFAVQWQDWESISTELKIWREGTTAGTTACADLYRPEIGEHQLVTAVRFDEHENSRTWFEGFCIPGGCLAPVFPLTSRTTMSGGLFPPAPSDEGDVGGWMYLDLDNRGRAAYSSSRLLAGPQTRTGPRPSQSWVAVSMRGSNGITSEVQGTPMANGCSPPAADPGLSYNPRAPITPGANRNPSAASRQGTPRTTNNDDSCDVAVMPAATLLLPYFDVDLNAPATIARTTLFRVTNVSNVPQIVRTTIWTDLGFPVYAFNLFLTGYDVQVINIYDILNRGVFAPTRGTSNLTTPGARSLANGANPHFLPQSAANCANLPGNIPPSALQDLRFSLTVGTFSTCGRTRIGRTHQNAIGYVTMDVVADCSATLPTDPAYFERELLFDNVLTGDYVQADPAPSGWTYGTGSPLIHIRATPEGGPAGERGLTNLPFTFYDRLTPDVDRRIDRRQPLPSAFAARFIEGGPARFAASAQIWREGATRLPFANGCRGYTDNDAQTVAEIVRFDEHENATAIATNTLPQPLASETSTSSAAFPAFSSPAGDVGGWMYLNLNNGGSTAYSIAPGRNYLSGSSTTRGPRQSQAWVTTTMFADGRFATASDAMAMGNGCSIAPAIGAPIRPAANETP